MSMPLSSALENNQQPRLSVTPSEARVLFDLLHPLADRSFEYQSGHDVKVSSVLDTLVAYTSMWGVSIEAVTALDESGTASLDSTDLVTDPDSMTAYEDIENRDAVRSLLAGLTDRERTILDLRYGLSSRDKGLSQKETATRLGISQQAVAKAEQKALTKCQATDAQDDEPLAPKQFHPKGLALVSAWLDNPPSYATTSTSTKIGA